MNFSASVRVRWARALGQEGPALVAPLSGDGSDRTFCRVAAGGLSAVLLHGLDSGAFGEYFGIASALGDHGVPLPRVLDSDEEAGWVLMEDAGCLNLCDFVRSDPPVSSILDAYRRVLCDLAAFQSLPASLSPWMSRRPYTVDTARWEAAYFRRRMVEDYLGLASAWSSAVESELEGLARRVGSEVRVPMHRDFQSRNLQVRGDGRITWIDFQGARYGPAFYDVASLLLDPYVELPSALWRRLFEDYLSQAPRVVTKDRGPDALWQAFEDAGIQRQLQALGAFGYLSQVGGKPAFEVHIRPGLSALASFLTNSGRFPGLSGLTHQAIAGLR